MRLLKILGLLIGLVAPAAAGPYESTIISTSAGNEAKTQAGIYYLNASSKQYSTDVSSNVAAKSTWTIVLDGPRSTVGASSGAFTAGVSVGTGPQASILQASPMGSTYALSLSSGILLTSGPVVLGNSDSFIKFGDGSSMRAAQLPAASISAGTVSPNVLITTANVQNGFNGANQFLKVGSDGKLSAIDGSNLTNVSAVTIALSTGLVVGQSTGGASSWGSGLGYNNGGGGYLINGWTLVGYSTGGVYSSSITFTGVKSSTTYMIDIEGNNMGGNGAFASFQIGTGLSTSWQVFCSSNDASTRARGSTGDSAAKLTGGDALFAGQLEHYVITAHAIQAGATYASINPFWGAFWTANTWHDNGAAVSETCTGGMGTTSAVAAPTTFSLFKSGAGGTWNGTIFVWARRTFISP